MVRWLLLGPVICLYVLVIIHVVLKWTRGKGLFKDDNYKSPLF
jgi:hypothetical protein